MIVYCCFCKSEVQAKLANREYREAREDLLNNGNMLEVKKTQFKITTKVFECPVCSNFVYTNGLSSNVKPYLDVILDDDLKEAKKHVDRLVTVILKSKKINWHHLRQEVLECSSFDIGKFSCRSVEEARGFYNLLQEKRNKYIYSENN